ncbi:MAG: GntR family transcriptional regulator [Subtercola sp.]|nr:GntR family transcriptional regulator [Subtercola sp.]
MSEPIHQMQVQRHAPIREQVASILRDAIIDMRLQPGQLLIERELCEMTAASRPSVREALRQLEAEGLVESQKGRGTFVSIADPVLAGHVYQVRAELEGFAAELFAVGASDELRDQLRTAFADIELAVAVDGDNRANSVLKAKNVLYEVLFLGAGNPILDQMLHTLQRRVNQLRALTLAQPGRPEQSVKEIRVIVEAIEKRDGAAARAAATSHVANAAATVLSALGATNVVPLIGR